MKFTFYLVCCLLAAQASFCQDRPYRKFATQDVYKEQLKADPGFAEKRHIIEDRTADLQSSTNEYETVTIPVIFHVLYNDRSDKPGEGQVMSQLESLNRDFNTLQRQPIHPADTLEGFLRMAAAPNIGFCLAKKGGIYYYHTSPRVWEVGNSMKYRENGGADVIEPDRNLNIWVADLGGKASGHAQMPGGPQSTDGIVIDLRYFGTMGTAVSPYDGGRTLTHLVGNYLNLFDLWGEGDCNDDKVGDTPVHNAPNHGCPGYKHLTSCNGNGVEMTMNFMDNTDDACMYMFTKGQVHRMRSALSAGGPRAGLVTGASSCMPGHGTSDDDHLSWSNGQLAQEVLSLKCFPSPAIDKVHLLVTSGENSPVSISIYSATGARVHYSNHGLAKGGQQFTIDCHNWASGLYAVKINNGGKTVADKFIVRGW
jgi:hypothetical protein